MPAAEKKKLDGGPGELSMLFEISQILDSSLDLRTVVEPVLEVITRSLGMKFTTLTLLNRQTGEISIEAAYGLSASQKRRGRYKLGEGITGKVIQIGQARHRAADLRGAALPGQDGRPQVARNGGPLLPLRAHQDGTGNDGGAERGQAGVRGTRPARRTRGSFRSSASLIAQAVRLRQSAQEERERLMEENLRLQDELKDRFRPSNIIGNSKAMQEVYQLISQVSASDTTVLLRGESGTGKELVAHAIHYASGRAARPIHQGQLRGAA